MKTRKKLWYQDCFLIFVKYWDCLKEGQWPMTIPELRPFCELSGQWGEVKEWDEESDPSSLYIVLATTFWRALATILSSGSGQSQPIRAQYCDVWTNGRRGDNDHSKSHGMTSGHLICPCIFCNWFCRQLEPTGNITGNWVTVMSCDKKFRPMMVKDQTKEMVANFCTK